MSETATFRHLFLKYCKGNGLDIGYGGDPIIPSAITIDLSYPKEGQHPLNLHGDARNLRWFKDNVLDYVYSSHCLEDCEQTKAVIKEWLRVLKKGGYFLLLLPEQVRYLKFCTVHGNQPNPSHKDPNFGLAKVQNILANLGIRILEVHPVLTIGDNDYNFAIISQK